MIDFLKNTASQAGKILLSYLNQENKIQSKGQLGFVSEADLASEKYIINQIRSHFPKSNIIAEETGTEADNEQLKKGLTWVIDPLDGTTNFIHGFPFFAVSIGVLENNQLLAGVVYNPATKEMFFAEKNKGAYLNETRIKVSSIDKIHHSLFITGFYYFQGEKLDQQIERFRKVQQATQSVRRLGAASLDICYIAYGKAEGYWEEGLNAWDVAAGSIILQESGGQFTDINGKKGEIFGDHFVYTNGLIHDQLLELIKID